MWILGVIAAVVLVVVWCLTHLPRATIGTGGGLSVTNSGLPLTNATIVTQYADGTRSTFTAGRVPRGISIIPIPSNVRQTGITGVSIDGSLFGLSVASYSTLGPE